MRTYPDSGPVFAHSSTLATRAISFNRSRVGVLSASCLLVAANAAWHAWAAELGQRASALHTGQVHDRNSCIGTWIALVVHEPAQQPQRSLVGHVIRRPTLWQAEVVHQTGARPVS